MSNDRPIGVFDSGIGGLTVAAAPYSDKSKELIAEYAISITRFLLDEKKCKAIVIACNTASAAAYEALRDTYKGSVPVINVIDPMIEEVIADDGIKKVGIIATKTTVASGVYQEKFARRKPALQFSALATPLLASMIEEGFYNNTISEAILNEYLSNPVLDNIDGLVLACTHYPLIKKEIDSFFHGKVKIFDSAEVVARKLKGIMEKESLLCPESSTKNEFFVSDYTRAFEAATKIFFKKEIHLELCRL